MGMSLIRHFWLLSLVARSLCALFNVTIDDTLGDESNGNMITYSAGWKLGQNCTNCAAKLDASEVFEHTWHDGTYYPVSLGGTGELITASASFIGALCVCIIPFAIVIV